MPAWPLEMQNDDAGVSRGVLADAVRNGDDGGWLERPAYQIEDNAKPSLSVNSVMNSPLPSPNATPRSTLHSLPGRPPVSLSPTCCRQRGLWPQWPCEVRRESPQATLFAGANNPDSQTRHCPPAIPRWKRRIPFLELVQQCDDHEVPRNHPRQPRNAPAHEAGPT